MTKRNTFNYRINYYTYLKTNSIKIKKAKKNESM